MEENVILIKGVVIYKVRPLTTWWLCYHEILGLVY